MGLNKNPIISGIATHADLAGRTIPDCHNINSISGLNTELGNRPPINNTNPYTPSTDYSPIPKKYLEMLSIAPVSVKTYGAKGDGITDDTAAINAAVSSSHNVVFFPEGVYMISSAIVLNRSNKALIGAPGAATIKLKGNSGAVDMISYNSAAILENVMIKDLIIDGNKEAYSSHANNTTCLNFRNMKNLVLDNLIVKNSLIEGVYIYKSQYVNINNLTTCGNGYYKEDASGLHVDTCTYVNVNNLLSFLNGFHGLILSGTSKSSFNNLVLHSNGFDGMDVQWDSTGNTFSNINSGENGRAGILVKTGAVQNTFLGVQLRLNDSGIVLYNSTEENTFASGVINQNHYGIQTVKSDAYPEWTNVSMSLCGVKISGNSLGNILKDPAHESEVVIRNIGEASVTVNGTKYYDENGNISLPALATPANVTATLHDTLLNNTAKNATAENNAKVLLADTGVSITRNVADANHALSIDLANASASGRILSLMAAGAEKAAVTKDGQGLFVSLFSDFLANRASVSNAQVTLGATGTIINRNVSDANPALSVDLANASATGKILSLKAAGVEKVSVDKTGGLSAVNVNAPNGTFTNLTVTTKTPASATAAGTAGQICWDANYLYVCVATNSWKRVAIAAW